MARAHRVSAPSPCRVFESDWQLPRLSEPQFIWIFPTLAEHLWGGIDLGWPCTQLEAPTDSLASQVCEEHPQISPAQP